MSSQHIKAGAYDARPCPTAGGRQPQYVWTNIELDWEDHQLVEARYRRETGELVVAVNTEPVFTRVLPVPVKSDAI